MVLLLLQGFGSKWCGFFGVTGTTEKSFPCALCTEFMFLCECIIKVQKQFNCLLPQTFFMRWKSTIWKSLLWENVRIPCLV